MSHEFRKTGSRDFFTLKMSYRFLLLWLPLIVGGLSLGFVGYFLSSVIAVQFGIDPSAPIIFQPHAHLFLFVAACAFIASGVTGVGITYALNCAVLIIARRLDCREAATIFWGAGYPTDWFQLTEKEPGSD